MSQWLNHTDHSDVDVLIAAMSDSSWGDCDDQLSTGGYVIFFCGGLVDF